MKERVDNLGEQLLLYNVVSLHEQLFINFNKPRGVLTHPPIYKLLLANNWYLESPGVYVTRFKMSVWT